MTLLNTLAKKKILIVTECFYPEEFKINDVALFWKNKGYEVSVLTLTPTYPIGKVYQGYKNKLFYKSKYQGIDIYRIRAVTGYKGSLTKKYLKYLNFMFFGSIFSIFIGRKYDFVFGYNLGALTDMLPAVIIKKLYKKPLMLWVQDIWPDSVYAYGVKETKLRSYWLNIFVRFIYSNATNIAISSKGFALKLSSFANNDKIFHYLPNWADDLKMSQKGVYLDSNNRIQFTFAGNIGKVQNLENIINAFCLLSKNTQKKAQLNIVGDGSNLEHLKTLSQGNKHIIFHGKVKRENMTSYYDASDFLIVSLIDKPIFSLTVPAKIQTYIAAKKPILGCIKGESADIINENNLGLCVDPTDVILIKELFQKCINMSDTEKAEFIYHSDKLLEKVFNKEIILSQMTEILIS